MSEAELLELDRVRGQKSTPSRPAIVKRENTESSERTERVGNAEEAERTEPAEKTEFTKTLPSRAVFVRDF